MFVINGLRIRENDEEIREHLLEGVKHHGCTQIATASALRQGTHHGMGLRGGRFGQAIPTTVAAPMTLGLLDDKLAVSPAISPTSLTSGSSPASRGLGHASLAMQSQRYATPHDMSIKAMASRLPIASICARYASPRASSGVSAGRSSVKEQPSTGGMLASAALST